jgi:hypothetical protein
MAKSGAEGAREVRHRAEVFVRAVSLPGIHAVQRMMEVIAPLRIGSRSLFNECARLTAWS